MGNEDEIGRPLGAAGKKSNLADSERNFIFLLLKTEGTGHAATTGRGLVIIQPQAPQDGFFVGHFHERLVMTMTVKQRPALQLRQHEVVSDLLQEFAEKKCLLRKFVRALVAGKDRKSTRLNSSHSQISYAVFCLKK